MLNETVYNGNLSRVIKLQDDLFLRIANLEIRDQCNSGFVVLDHSVAIIDYPVQQPDHEIIDEAEKLTGLPVKYILLTHAHCDHVTGFRTLRRKDISIVARTSCIAQLYLEGYPVPPIERAVEQSERIVLDGKPFQLTVPTHIAHSPWDMLIGIPAYGVVFTGDMVALHKNMFFHSSDLDGWIKELEALSNSQWKWIARGHGEMIPIKELECTIQYLNLLWQAREWQRSHNENVTVDHVGQPRQTFSPELAKIVEALRKEVDAYNVARQINQLYWKLR